ncbi:MAG: Ig-like domain-containing protein, partial [Planctomycetota bacterium]
QDAPTAADKTVTTNEDTAYTFSAADFGFSDVDAGDSLTKIQITSLESVGTLRLSGANVTLNQEILAADIGNLVFTPVPNANGTGYDSFDFKVHDGTEYSAAANTITVDVVAVEDAPTAADELVVLLTDTSHTFSAADFNFSDADGDSLFQIQITSLETAGNLKLGGVDVTLNQVIAAADIAAGNLVFTPGTGESGAAYSSFDFKVHDSNQYSAAAYTWTVDVVDSVPPTAAAGPDQLVDPSSEVMLDATGSTDADGEALDSVQTSGVEFQANTNTTDNQHESDISMADDGSFVVVWESDLGKSAGIMGQRYDVNGDPTGSEFTIHTTSGNLRDPVVEMADDGSFVVVWQGADADKKGIFGQRFDNTGTAVGGEFLVNTDTTGDQKTPAIAMADDSSFIVAWAGQDVDGNGIFAQRYDAGGSTVGSEFQVNTDTIGNQKVPAVAMAPDGSFVIAWEGLDADAQGVFAQRYDSNGDMVGSEFAVNTTTTGAQKNAAVAVADDGSFVVAWEGVDADKKGIFAQRFDADGSAAGSEFVVNTTTAGDQKLPATAIMDDGRFIITWEGTDADQGGIFAQRYEADGTAIGGELLINATTTGAQGTPSIAMNDSGDFVVAWDGVDADVEGVFGQKYTSRQDLTYTWTQISGTPVTLSDANSPNPTFTAPGTTGNLVFEVSVSDGGTAVTDTVTITVDTVPTAADKTVTTNEDTGYTFAAADFGFSDVDAGDSLTKIQITSLESNGTLKLSGVDVTLNQEILVADIGNLVFTPAQDANGTGYDSFDFKVHDGLEYSVAANTITVDVTAVQDAPTAADKTVTTNEDTAYTFSAADFGFSDVDAGDSLTKIQITSLESNGTLKLSGADVTLNQEILVADIGNLVFMPAQDANGASYDSFDFKVHDGTEYSVAANTITVDVTAVQDAPTAADKTVTTNEDTAYTFSAADFGFSDVDVSDSLTKIQIT